MIRRAIENDIGLVVDYGRDFHEYSPWSSIPFDRLATEAFVRSVIDRGVIFLGEGGMIGGVMNPLYFNPSYSVACELFWWAKSGGRKLMQAFEEWGVNNNAKGIQFSALGDDKSDRMDVLFNRAGYRKVEIGYFKDIC